MFSPLTVADGRRGAMQEQNNNTDHTGPEHPGTRSDTRLIGRGVAIYSSSPITKFHTHPSNVIIVCDAGRVEPPTSGLVVQRLNQSDDISAPVE